MANGRTITGSHLHVTAVDSFVVCASGGVTDPEIMVSSQSKSDVTVHDTRVRTISHSNTTSTMRTSTMTS